MKHILTISFLSLITSPLFCQDLLSGKYDSGMFIAFDKQNAKITGYFENYTGWDEETKSPRFSCIFYIEGKVDSSIVTINTFYPEDKTTDRIIGSLRIDPDSAVSIKLPEEHGGCWNVHHFADSYTKFDLLHINDFIQIRYATSPKAYFYSDTLYDKKSKAYVVKNDFLFISKIMGDWAFCTFSGKKITSGWIKLEDLNEI